MSAVSDAFAPLLRPMLSAFAAMGAVAQLLIQTLYWVLVGPFTGKTRFRAQVFDLMHQIGVRSMFITCLVSLLVGGILVLQTADKFQQYGAMSIVPQMICIAVVRELGPLMTAIVISGRVGAAFTAGLGTMVINEEVLALRTMGINPVGYLVAPRFIAICVMLPCLTIYSYLVGNLGGLLAGTGLYRIPVSEYMNTAHQSFTWEDSIAGVVKALVFAIIICMVSCQNALSVRGGPNGVARNTMVSVVVSLVSIIVADAMITWIMTIRFY